jgi:ribosomal protein L29
MTDRIEYWAQINDKKVNELTEKNKALEKELAEIKQILMSGGFYGNV